MVIEHQRAIRIYWEKVKHKYPGIPLAHFVKICSNPYVFARKCMRDGTLPFVYIKHIGKIRVFPGSIITLKRLLIEWHEKGWIKENEFQDRIEFLNNYHKLLLREEEPDNDFIIAQD